MGAYGPGIGFTDFLNLSKERVKKALEHKVWIGEENGDGFVYENCTKERADAEILNVFDEVAHHAIQLTAGGTAMERVARKKGVEYDMFEYLDEYSRAMKQFDGYECEPEDDRDGCWGIQ